MFFYPVYELTVYAPRSVDATEATVLTPAAGAVHADQFIVTSKQGIAGAKPYLEDPSGRSATIDPLTKTTTVGTWKLRLLDARVTAGGTNAARWVTAFLGDGKGGNVLLGRKVRVRQSLDNAATWEAVPFLTGRIYNTALDGKPWIELTVRDLSKDLDVEVFVGPPHASITAGLVAYPTGHTHLAHVAPLGLLQRYGGFPLTTPLKGTVSTRNAGVSEQRPTFGITLDRADGDPTRTLVTKAVVDAANAALVRRSSSTLQPPKIFLRVAGSGGVFTEYDLATINDIYNRKFTSITRLSGRQTNKPGSAVRPVAGTVIEFYIADPTAEPSEQLPLLIDDVDPIQHLRNLCAGKYGKLDGFGDPLRSIPINAASFAAVDTGRYIPWRQRVTKKSKLSAEIEQVCRAYHLGYYLNGAGELTIVDLRRLATTAPAATLVDADLLSPANALHWEQSGDTAVTAVLGSYYLERQLLPEELPIPFEALDRQVGWAAVPDIPSIGIADADMQSKLVPVIGPRAGDVKTSTFKIDATGFRARIETAGEGSTENYQGGKRVDAIHAHIDAYAGEITGPYGLGASFVDVVCRRASANVAAILQGKFAALNLSALPDPATNQRGGVRLAFCVSRAEEGPNVKFRFLDAGANSVALVPTVGALTAWNGTTVGVQVPITLNAAGEPTRVSYAITDPSVGAVPAENDPRWTTGSLVTTSSTAILTDLPRNIRVWVRARSEPTAGAGYKLPSAWAFPAVGFIAAGVLNPPTGLAVAAVSVETALASWTNGEDWAETDVMLVVGAAPGTWLDSMIVARLSAGSTRLVLSELVSGGITYTIGIRHRDETGGVSTIATAGFTPGAASTLSAPRNPDAFSRASSVTRFGLIGRLFPQGLTYGLAVIATVHPSLVEFAVATETGVGTGVYGAYETVAQVEAISGSWTMWSGIAPNDGLRRKLKARHIRAGANPSLYCAEVVATPGTFDPLAEYPIAPPTIKVTLVTRIRSTETVMLDGAIGANDAGPLQWRYKLGNAAWSAYFGVALPQSLTFTRPVGYAAPLVVEVLQADGQSQSAAYSIHPRDADAATLTREDVPRSGTGGLPTPRGRIITDALYSRDGTTPYIDTELGRATSNLAGPTGVGMTVVERGGNKGDNALDVGFKLQTGVTVGATAADGVAGIESGRGAKTKATRLAGPGGQIVQDGLTKSGMGGVMKSGSRYSTDPIYDRTGVSALIDTDLMRLLSSLKGPNGDYDMTVIERGGGKGDGALDDSSTLKSGVRQSDGITARVIAKGHTSGNARNGTSVSFPLSYQNVPLVLLRGGINHEPRAKWGPNGDGTEAGAYTTTLPTIEDMTPLNLTVSGFTLRARLRQKAVATARSANADTAGNSLTTVGATAAATLNNAPNGAISDLYTVHFNVSVTCTNPPPVPPPGSPKTASVTIAIDTSSDGGSNWTQRASYTYNAVASPNSSSTETYTHEMKSVAVSGLDSNATADKIRIRIVSASATSGASVTFAAHLYSTANGDPTGGLTYATSAGDSYASKTPDAEDAIYWEAIEVS